MSFTTFRPYLATKIHFFFETTNIRGRFSWNPLLIFQKCENAKMRKCENENISSKQGQRQAWLISAEREKCLWSEASRKWEFLLSLTKVESFSLNPCFGWMGSSESRSIKFRVCLLLKQLTVYWQGWQSNHFLDKTLSCPNCRLSLLVCSHFDFPVGPQIFSRGSARFSRRRRCDDIINCQPPKFWQSEIFDSGGCGVVCTSIFCMSQESPLKGATARLPKEFG